MQHLKVTACRLAHIIDHRLIVADPVVQLQRTAIEHPYMLSIHQNLDGLVDHVFGDQHLLLVQIHAAICPLA
ncbi:hypothetical protein D3C76_1653190 [compost metagenome]